MKQVKNLFNFILDYKQIFLKYPVEISINIIAYIAYLYFSNTSDKYETSIMYMLIISALSYFLNSYCKEMPLRVIYYISGFMVLFPFFAANWVNKWSDTPQAYLTLLALAPIALLLSHKQRENNLFVANGITIVNAGALTTLFITVIQLLMSGIVISFLYIFDLDETFDFGDIFEEFFFCTCYFVAPPMFLSFITQRADSSWSVGRIGNIMINYIISPALLIYSIILYIYFIKIIIMWQLPRGGVAYMVFAFAILASLSKIIVHLMGNVKLRWYYNYFSFIAIPALLMFWIGVIRRVEEFGLTEARVYLMICGVIMTLWIMFSLSKKFSYYNFFIALFILFAAMAYIPGISAKDFALRNQIEAAKELMTELPTLINSDSLKKENIITKRKRLRSAIGYIEREDKSELNKIGVDNVDSLLKSLSEEEGVKRAIKIYISDGGKELVIDNLSKYKELIYLTADKDTKKKIYYTADNETIKIFYNGDIIFEMPIKELINTQLKLNGYDIENPPTEDIYKDDPYLFLRYENDKYVIYFSELNINYINGFFDRCNAYINFLLVK